MLRFTRLFRQLPLSSEEVYDYDLADNDIRIVRGKRVKRRRRNSPVNLRPPRNTDENAHSDISTTQSIHSRSSVSSDEFQSNEVFFNQLQEPIINNVSIPIPETTPTDYYEYLRCPNNNTVLDSRKRRKDDTDAGLCMTINQEHDTPPLPPSEESSSGSTTSGRIFRFFESIFGTNHNGIRKAAGSDEDIRRKNTTAGGGPPNQNPQGASGGGGAGRRSAAPPSIMGSRMAPSSKKSRMDDLDMLEKRKLALEKIKSKLAADNFDEHEWNIAQQKKEEEKQRAAEELERQKKEAFERLRPPKPIEVRPTSPPKQDPPPRPVSPPGSPPKKVIVKHPPPRGSPPGSPKKVIAKPLPPGSPPKAPVVRKPPPPPPPVRNSVQQPQKTVNLPLTPDVRNSVLSQSRSTPRSSAVPVQSASTVIPRFSSASTTATEASTVEPEIFEMQPSEEIPPPQAEPLPSLSKFDRFLATLSIASSSLSEILFHALVKLTENNSGRLDETFDDGVKISSDEEEEEDNFSTNEQEDEEDTRNNENDDQLDSEWLEISDEEDDANNQVQTDHNQIDDANEDQKETDVTTADQIQTDIDTNPKQNETGADYTNPEQQETNADDTNRDPDQPRHSTDHDLPRGDPPKEPPTAENAIAVTTKVNPSLRPRCRCCTVPPVLLKVMPNGGKHSAENVPRKGTLGHQYALKHLHHVLPIFRLMIVLGRFPFEIDLSQDVPQFKLNKCSWRYFFFLVTSSLSFVGAILLVINLVIIVTIPEPFTFHETILRLEQDKHWMEAVIEASDMVFVALSSVCLLECNGGFFAFDYLNRWYQAISIVRYDVTPGLRKLIYTFFGMYTLYALIVILLFFLGGEEFPTSRGMCGYIGLLILHSFTSEIRLRPFYRVVEYFGLFTHLYVELVGDIGVVFFAVHCLALQNAAKKFNHRLAGCLRGVGFKRYGKSIVPTPEDGYPNPPPHVVVPYTKLFAEHLVVSSFPRQIGQAFSAWLLVYLGCKMSTMIVTLYGVAEPLVNGFPESKEQFFNVSAQSTFDPDEIVPVLIVEPNHIYVIKSYLYVAKTWLQFFVFLEIVRRPGKTVLRGASLIIHKTYLHCKTKHALRFITTMNFSYGNRVVLRVNPAIEMSRVFIGKFGGFALLIVLTLIQFIPAMINSQGVMVCDHLGGCFFFEFPIKIRAHSGVGMALDSIVNELNKRPKVVQPAVTVPPPPKILDFPYPPCEYPPPEEYDGGRMPLEISDFAIKCSRGDDIVYIPTYFKRIDSSREGYTHVLPNPGNLSCSQSLDLSQLLGQEGLLDCFGENVTETDIKIDECGNPKLGTPDDEGNKKLPVLSAVKFESGEIFCCYNYEGDLTEQGKRCNLLSTESEKNRCKWNPSSVKDRAIRTKTIHSNWSSSGEVSEEQHDFWTKCLCQGIDETEIPTNPSACVEEKAPEPKPPPPPPELCRDGLLPKIGSKCSTSSPIENKDIYKKHYLSFCKGHVVPTVRSFKGPKSDLFKYPCGKQTKVLNTLSLKGIFYDCFGGFTYIQGNGGLHKDDCGIHRIPFPDGKSGKKILPVAQVVKLDDSVQQGNPFSYMCCWNYEEYQDKSLKAKCNLFPGSDHSSVCSIRNATIDADAVEVCTDIRSSNYFIVNGNNTFYEKTCMDDKGVPLIKCNNS